MIDDGCLRDGKSGWSSDSVVYAEEKPRARGNNFWLCEILEGSWKKWIGKDGKEKAGKLGKSNRKSWGFLVVGCGKPWNCSVILGRCRGIFSILSLPVVGGTEWSR